ncbi:MAG: hypothetical protein ACKO2C_01265, partial [Actinomycetes bacterium]
MTMRLLVLEADFAATGFANAIAEGVRDARPDHSRVAYDAMLASLDANGVTRAGANARVWRARTGLHAV